MSIIDRFRGASVMQSLQLGEENGATITEVRRYSQAVDPGSVAANTVAGQNFTVTGIAVGDVVLGVMAGNDLGVGIGSVRTSAANRVRIEFVNPTGSAVNPASSTWVFIVAKVS